MIFNYLLLLLIIIIVVKKYNNNNNNYYQLAAATPMSLPRGLLHPTDKALEVREAAGPLSH